MPALSRLVLAALLGLAADPVLARTLEAGPGKEYAAPSAAIAAAKKGDTVSIQPGEYFDCATVRSDDVVIQGVGDWDKVILTDKVCGGKGLLIITGNNVTVRNLTLARARVPDNNGAGIRNEAADLTVDHVRFVNNENGILSTPSNRGTLTVRNSLFERNGSCRNEGGGCAHGVYVDSANLFVVENTVFTGTRRGHHIKSRALRTEVVGSTIADGEEGTASYLIEVPSGGSLIVRNSTLQKGAEAENHSAAIVIGAEGVSQPTR